MAKGMMIIDGQRVSFDGEKNVLSVIRKAGIEMPTFCYYSDLSVYGACRMCVVENEETGKIDASCSMEPRNGMRIRTNSARLLKHRRVILELLLASHNCNCTTCEKSGHCHLQTLAQQFGVRRIRFEDTRERYEIDNTSPAVLRDPNKCILCGDCVRVCEEIRPQNGADQMRELRSVRRRVPHRRDHGEEPDRRGVARHPRPEKARGHPDRACGPRGRGRGLWHPRR